ncbi:MAG: superfamily II DNA helicase RecQ, partial [Candidatus Paceibacteria bacterium]
PKDGTGGLDPVEMELHDRLKAWRRKMSDKEDFDASLILNRHVLVRLVSQKPSNTEGLQAIEGLLEWQIERYGDGVLEVIDHFQQDVQAGRVETGARRRGKRSKD